MLRDARLKNNSKKLLTPADYWANYQDYNWTLRNEKVSVVGKGPNIFYKIQTEESVNRCISFFDGSKTSPSIISILIPDEIRLFWFAEMACAKYIGGIFK